MDKKNLLSKEDSFRIVNTALRNCANNVFNGDLEKIPQAFVEQQSNLIHCLHFELAHQLGLEIGKKTPLLRGVFYLEVSQIKKTGIDLFSFSKPEELIFRFIFWVQDKKEFDNQIEENISTAIKEYLAENQNIPGKITIRLDIEFMDDLQVHNGKGLSILLHGKELKAVSAWNYHGDMEKGEIQTGLTLFDTGIATESMLFEQAEAIEQLSEHQAKNFAYRYQEIKVALIRRLISDQLEYIQIAKDWFTLSDLKRIYERRIGLGKIGGKAAGMLLAERIITDNCEDQISKNITVPESYFLGSDLSYIFMAMNGLMHWNDQKYKSAEQIADDFATIQEVFSQGDFPPEYIYEFKNLLASVAGKPIIVRSSSQLEDNFGSSFAGKYQSFFLPNQGSDVENLKEFTQAITQIYAWTFNPDVLLYRRSRGFQDYDERMAILVQTVQGEKFGKYYFPFGAGVAFSRNLFRWSPQIKKEAGLARLVWGLGTRAVQRIGDDYPRIIALSHPTLQPDDSTEALRFYSQQMIDCIDLENNCLVSLPIKNLIKPGYKSLRYLVQIEQDGYFSTPRSRIKNEDIEKIAITYHELLARTPFAGMLSSVLQTLETHYHVPVDIEFTVKIPEPLSNQPEVELVILQCRPQSILQKSGKAVFPKEIRSKDVVFLTHYMVPQGVLEDIRYVLFVNHEEYFNLPTAAARNKLGRIIASINEKMEEKSFICVGPGRWGTTNFDLGVFIKYGDIHKSAALVELFSKEIGSAPEPSLGTHFFQDLMEGNIYPVAIDLDKMDTIFSDEFFYETPNLISDWVETDEEIMNCLKVISVDRFRSGHVIRIIMDDELSKALAYLEPQA
ncbi:MAG: PEP/pyruvate-binding domain-containing protein [Anaerolineaceae bacterium]|nr:PEP/pyruvate-binding domain-containing protein [Anaerolineaceae bacterium]